MRSSLVSARTSFSREPLYTSAIIFGWVVAFTAALLSGLYVHNEYTFERFIAGYQDVYRLEADILAPGTEPRRTDMTLSSVAGNLVLDFPQVQYAARLARSTQWVGDGEAKSRQRVAWVDRDFFDVLPFPVREGDAVAAVHEPNSLVLTRSMARTYFGEANPLGKTLLVQAVAGDPATYPMVVKAILEDPPGETHLEQFQIFASGVSASSPLTEFDRNRGFATVWTYLRLRPGASVDAVRQALPGFAERHSPNRAAPRFRLERVSDLHFAGDAHSVNARIASVGALIIAVAAINFVTLVTARGTRRSVEVGVRKVVGARRRDLIVQFVGEALVYVFVALFISIAIVKLALPPINTFLQRTITFDLFANPQMLAAILVTALFTALIAGIYPAVVLSSLGPATALRRGGGKYGSAVVRQVLVVVQFGILVGLIITATTISRQTHLVLENVTRLNEDQVVYIVAPCERTLKEQIATVSGVVNVTCASNQAASQFPVWTTVRDSVKGAIRINVAPVDIGFFDVHELAPIAGRFPSKDHGQDMVLDQANPDPGLQPTVVLNESGARQLGFVDPKSAVGASILWSRPFAVPPGQEPKFVASQVIGVTPDFTLGTFRESIEPTMYFVDPMNTGMIWVQLDTARMEETLRSIDEVWRRSGQDRPIFREFLGDTMRQTYRDVIVQGRIIGVGTALAVLIACLGLFALAVFTTERQRKEIGVRKVVGASSFEIVRLLLWRFTKPVLWANVIAWPIAFWTSRDWLEGFAYRVSLPLWLFVGASAVALLIAWATVGTHAWLAARAKPSASLRYE